MASRNEICDAKYPLDVSIIIPTLNAEKYLGRLLTAIESQSLPPTEILIVDSSSTDATPLIVQSASIRNSSIRFVSIAREEFGHGKTRNLAADMSRSSIMVFITQDALPASDDWLKNLVTPFRTDSVGCVFGRHLPKPGGNPLIALDIERHFSTFGSEDYLVQHVNWTSKEDIARYKLNMNWYCFNSNVNSAVRKDVWEKIRFRDVMYSEDQLFGKDLIESGIVKIYARNAQVYHSHEYTLIQYFRRYFDEYRGLKITLGITDNVTLYNIIPIALITIMRDMIEIISRNIDNKLYWLCYTVIYHVARRLGAYLGGRYESIPTKIRSLLSLEGRPR